ncbi:thiol-activated cytolysin family protein [Flavobacteriales bacterium]|nr:thiol-activated cytolysin family protein [Flavobacteriales bacterium]
MKNLLLQSTLIIIVFSFLFISCKKDPAEMTFQSVIDLGGTFDEPVNSETKTTSVDTVVNGDSLWACTTETYSVIQGMQEFPLFNPNSSVVYPGNMLQGGSLKNATPDVIVVDRAGGTFSIDIISGGWDVTATVDEVVKSKVATALNDIVANQAYSSIPSNISFSLEEVHTEQQLALALGVDFTAYGVAIASELGFTNSYDYNRVLVKLSQSYYTMSYDLPANYDDLFAPSVTPENLEPYVGPGNPACYISDVTYGRVFYLLVESTSSATSISSSINASFSAIPNAPSASVNTSYLSSLENLNIKLFALGGDATTTLYTIGNSNVNNLVTILGAAGDITTGVPLSYVCRAVNGNNIVSVNLATSYDVESCEPIGPIQGAYGDIPEPILYLKAEDANTSNNGILSYNNATNPDLGEYMVDYYYGTNVGGLVVENWPDDAGVNIASTSDPNNRPIFVPNALNGYPAIDFCHFSANGLSNSFDQTVTTELDLPGALFTNTNYTLFMVVSSPTKLNVEGDNISDISNESIDAGTFLQGSDAMPYGQLSVGFNSNSNLLFGHNLNDLNVPVSRSSDFRLLTMRFSTIDGMTAFINNSDVPLASDPSLNLPLTSNNGLKLNASSLSSPGDNTRSQVVEIRAFNVALTDLDRLQIANVILNKYGL